MWRPAALVLAVMLVYANSVSGPFVLDDELTVVQNQQIRDLSRLGAILAPERELPVAGRPLANFSFALNYAAGGFDPTGYHVVNIGLHALCALLLFGIVRRTFQNLEVDERPRRRPPRPRQGGVAANASALTAADLGFFAALLWAVHPLNTEAVNYITQRTELMMGLFFLLTLYTSIRGWTLAAVVACAAGMACKESMVTAPVVVFLYDRIFKFPSVRQAMAARWRLYGGLAATWILLGVLISSGPRIHSAGFESGVSAWTYLLNQSVMIRQYLRLVVWPVSLVMTYGWPQPLVLTDVLPSAALIVALCALTIFALARYPKAGFLCAAFFITLAPSSSFVPIATEVGADRRMYLPLAALIVLAVSGVGRAARNRWHTPRYAVPAGAIGVAMLLAAATMSRNREYRSPLDLARMDVERWPTSLGHHVLAGQLIAIGRHDEAMAELRLALPGAPRAHYMLGIELLNAGKIDEGISELQAFIQKQPLLLEAVDARLMLSQAFSTKKQWTDVIEEARTALRMNPSRSQAAQAEGLTGDALYGQEDYANAAAAYQKSLALEQTNVHIWIRLGLCFVATDRLSDAIIAFRKAVEIEPQSGEARFNLATALLDQNEPGEAVVHAREAVRLRPGDAGTRELLNQALARQREGLPK